MAFMTSQTSHEQVALGMRQIAACYRRISRSETRSAPAWMRGPMTAAHDSISERLLGLHWLIRLRWIAVHGQTLACLAASVFLRIHLPFGILAACIGFTAITNLLLVQHRKRSGGGERWLKPVVLGSDVITLTVMLYFTGGAHNPFTMFYLLHVTMAVILLPAWGAWAAVALCTAGFWILFRSDHTLVSDLGVTCCNDMNAHLQGLIVSMVLTGCGISYFVSRLTAGLRESRSMMAMARADGERARRTTEVATLAAGIAHELATPLGTIAVVSQDLEAMAGKCCSESSCAEDARLIRQEVERCRLVIAKLGKTGRTPNEARKPIPLQNLSELLSAYVSEMVRDRLEVWVNPTLKRPLLPQSRLLQCLSILVKNASEASPQESAIVLKADIADGHCIFQVLDRGPGFPEGFHHRIGEPLLTTKEDNGGLGLGLYLVKAFVTDLGGSLHLGKGPDGETLVELRLPFVENPS
jgi:two-component system, sensor histidine kinase RegB